MFTEFNQTPLAYLVILATMAISFYAWYDPPFFMRNRMHPYSIFRGRKLDTAWNSIWIHINYKHLLVNVFLLLCSLTEVEYILVNDFGRKSGTIWFVFFIVLSAAVAGGLSALQYRHQPFHWSAGASALIMAAIFVYLLYYPTQPIPDLQVLSRYILPYTIASVLLLVLLLLVWLKDPAGGIHLYGALAGILFVLIVRPEATTELRDRAAPAIQSEERNDPSAWEDQCTGHTQYDLAQDRAFPAGTTDDGIGLFAVQTLHPLGNQQHPSGVVLFVHNSCVLGHPCIGV